jgi:CheY-like chemotaxis protein
MAKILIVDDDPVMHLLYRGTLEKAGYQFAAASTAQGLLPVCEKEKPDLVLMDVMMPAVDGITALKDLKKQDSTKNIVVVVITANVSEHGTFRREAEAAGAAGFLTKPFSPQQLLTEVKKLLPHSGG